MTISSTASEVSYAGDGVSTVFPIPFVFDSASDLTVIRTDPDGNPVVLSSGYTTSGGNGSTGSLTLTGGALASGYKLTILDNPERTQTADYIANDDFPAESHERALDRGVRISKRLYQLIQRCLRTDDGDPITGAGTVLGSVQARKGKYLFFNAVTGAIEYATALIGSTLSQSIIGQFLNPQTVAEASAGVTPTNYWHDEGDLRRYGGLGDGSTDDSTAWQRAVAVGRVRIPKGFSFKVLTGTTKSGAVHIEGEGSTSKILCDGSLLTLTSGDHSTFRNFAIENITAPLTIQRRVESTVNTTASITSGSSTITVASATGLRGGMQVYGLRIPTGTIVTSVVGTTLVLADPCGATASNVAVKFFDITYNMDAAAVATAAQSNDAGRYTPNSNDTDVWPSLTSTQQSQAQTGVQLNLTGDHITIDGVYGRHLSILFDQSSHCTVRNCDLRGGWTWAAIAFLNGGTSRTKSNRVLNNLVQDHGFNGILFMGCDGCTAIGNTVIGVGETGIKTYQTGAGLGSSPYSDACTAVTSIGNKVIAGFEGAFDYQTTFAVAELGAGSSGSVSQGDYAAWCPFGAFGFGGRGWRIDITAELNPGPALYAVVSDSVIGGIFRENMYDNLNGGIANNLNISGSNNIISGLRGYQESGRWNATTGYMLALTGGTTALRSSTIVDCDLRDAITAAGGAIQVNNFVTRHNLRTNGAYDVIDQEFLLWITNTGGTMQHSFLAQSAAASLGNFVEKITGASAALQNTPTGTDSSTAMANGGKIGSASTNKFWCDTADQIVADAYLSAVVVLNDTGTAVTVRPQIASIDINGVTRNRLVFDFLNATSGAAFALTGLASGKSIQVQFMGRLS